MSKKTSKERSTNNESSTTKDRAYWLSRTPEERLKNASLKFNVCVVKYMETNSTTPYNTLLGSSRDPQVK